MNMTPTLLEARDLLLAHRADHERACATFLWPSPARFDFATEWFDMIASQRDREALRIVNTDGITVSRLYSELAISSRRTAGFLHKAGLRRGDAVLLMLGPKVALWETFLACIRLGAVVIPATTLLEGADLADRLARGAVRFVVTESPLTARFGEPAGWTGIAVGAPTDGWLDYEDAASEPEYDERPVIPASDPLLLYFTSGTTERPKLVVHDRLSYPVGHLSTMYWLGLMPGDKHLNISSAGWAKHAWSSMFAPWLAEATVVTLDHPRFDARKTLDALAEQGITSFCAPPTVWRMLIQQELGQTPARLREACSAGEPLNPEVIEQFRKAWGITIRDGFGQTETTALIGNTPGMPIKPGSVGKPLPGFALTLRDADGDPAEQGEICVDLLPERPVGMMRGYANAGSLMPSDGEFHRTGDIAMRDGEGYLTFVGRDDDLFKSSDYRISPFELESVLIEHPAVAEAAVVPSPDPLRLAVPKAFLTLAPGVDGDSATARSIFDHCRARLSNYKRIRRLEFAQLPKTISGKIRRVELRRLEAERRANGERGSAEWTEQDFATETSA